jgi:hypothetical protein
VVKFQSFLAVVGCQCVNGIGQCWQGMFHEFLVKVQ